MACGELKWNCQHVQKLRDGQKPGFVTSLGNGISGNVEVVAELREMRLRPVLWAAPIFPLVTPVTPAHFIPVLTLAATNIRYVRYSVFSAVKF